MLAASYWSLLAPAIEMAEDSGRYGDLVFVPVSIGFIAGALFVAGADAFLPYLVILFVAFVSNYNNSNRNALLFL